MRIRGGARGPHGKPQREAQRRRFLRSIRAPTCGPGANDAKAEGEVGHGERQHKGKRQGRGE